MRKGIIEIWRQWGMVILFSRNPSSMNLQKFLINPNIMKNRLRSLMFVFLWRQGQKRWFQLRIANQGLLSYMYKNVNPFQNYLFLFCIESDIGNKYAWHSVSRFFIQTGNVLTAAALHQGIAETCPDFSTKLITCFIFFNKSVFRESVLFSMKFPTAGKNK